MKIIQIQLTPKKWYQLTFETGETIKVNEDVFVKHGFYKGQELSKETFQQVEEDVALSLGMFYAYRRLSYGMRTILEIQKYLREKGIEEAHIEVVLEKLKGQNLLNDQHYAQTFVRSQKDAQKSGPKEIAQKLKLKGIDSFTIEDALAEYTDEEQIESAENLAYKLFKKYQRKSFREQLNKTKQGLYQKGFYQKTIDVVMSNLEVEKDEEEEFDLLYKEAEKIWRRHSRKERIQQKLKTKQSLYQKGFELGKIDEVLQIIQEEEEDDDA